jgi:hypothetical protein
MSVDHDSLKKLLNLPPETLMSLALVFKLMLGEHLTHPPGLACHMTRCDDA